MNITYIVWWTLLYVLIHIFAPDPRISWEIKIYGSFPYYDINVYDKYWFQEYCTQLPGVAFNNEVGAGQHHCNGRHRGQTISQVGVIHPARPLPAFGFFVVVCIVNMYSVAAHTLTHGLIQIYVFTHIVKSCSATVSCSLTVVLHILGIA